MRKGFVTLGGIALAGNSPITWRFQTGTRPFTTVMQFHESLWPRLKSRLGQPLELRFKDSRDVLRTIKEVYILHRVASDTPARISVVVSDLRWKWSRPLIVRDYNVPKKSGDRSLLRPVPIETSITVDDYDFRRYSLYEPGVKWTVRTALEDVLEQLTRETNPALPSTASGPRRFAIDSLPIEERGTDGEFTIQNLTLRDSGDAALARLLTYIPGAEVWIDENGVARIFDGADLGAARQLLEDAGVATYDGQKVEEVDRKAIRPGKVNVYFTREVEVAFTFEDDYGATTTTRPVRGSPYLQNVLPTVDTSTTVTEYDPETDTEVTKEDLPPGVWVDVKAWLAAMDKVKPPGSAPWTWDNIRRSWIVNDLENLLGGRDLDRELKANVAKRIQALREHFRRTFRISRRYTERIRNLRPKRVAVLDPISGARAEAGVWGQFCIIPPNNAKGVAARAASGSTDMYINVDSLPAGNASLNESTPAPAKVTVLDQDLGVFQVQWQLSPYGTVGAIVPCNVGKLDGTPAVPQKDFATQSTEPWGPGYTISGGGGGCYLADKMKLQAILTVVPAAPNNKNQLERVQLEAEDIAKEFRMEFGIEDGTGPELDVFVPPGEVTARFAWSDTARAEGTIGALLGLNNDDPKLAGIPPGSELDGYEFANKEREIQSYATATAAQEIAAYADSVQGVLSTVMPSGGVEMKGNVSGVTIRVGAAPSAKFSTQIEFTGQQKTLSRYAFLPEAARQSILGVVAFKE